MTTLLSEETKLLASYSTYKALYDDHKTVYEIVAAFINDAVVNDRGHFIYTQSELANLGNGRVGFNIPDVVIGTAAHKHVDCLKKINKNEYRFIENNAVDDRSFNDKINRSIESANFVYEGYRHHLDENVANYDINEVNDALVNYLLDKGSVDDALRAHISAFIIENSNSNPEFIETINNIRRGHCLLTGLTNNNSIGETNSWNSYLTIYLDTEILFSIAGYNGELFQKVARDFLDVVKEVNTKKKCIKLKFFSDSKDDIVDYFVSAKWNLNSPDPLRPQRTAMRYLLGKCRTESDLAEEEERLISLLSRNGIHEDTITQFNDQGLSAFNFEDLGLLDKYAETIERRDESDKDEEWRKNKAGKRIREISNINKLRKGRFYTDYRDCGYLFVTGTGHTFSIYRDMMKLALQESKMDGNYGFVDYAVSLTDITNAIWYRLNNTLLVGHTAKFPVETDGIVRAQMILASLLQTKAEEIFENAKMDLDDERRSKEDIISGLSGILKKIKKPEEITPDTVKDDLTLITSEDIELYENKNAYLSEQNKIKDERISELEKGEIENQKKIESQEKELEEAKRKIEIHNCEDQLSDIEDCIKQYEYARKKCCIIDRSCKIAVSIVIILLIIGVWAIWYFYKWDWLEQYTFLIPLSFTAIVAIFGLFKPVLPLIRIVENVAGIWKKKYDEQLNTDIDSLIIKRDALTRRLMELENYSSESEGTS